MLMGETILSNKLKTLHLKEREGGRTEEEEIIGQAMVNVSVSGR